MIVVIRGGRGVNGKVVLVHGFNKNSNDMLQLKENLAQLGYKGITVNLPLTFKEIETAIIIFRKEIKILISNLDDGELIHFAGHSMGGLITRAYVENDDFDEGVGYTRESPKNTRKSQTLVRKP